MYLGLAIGGQRGFGIMGPGWRRAEIAEIAERNGLQRQIVRQADRAAARSLVVELERARRQRENAGMVICLQLIAVLIGSCRLLNGQHGER